MYVELTAADDRLVDYTSLTDVALRKKLETERGLYMAESTNVIMRAVQAGHKPRSFLTAPKWLDSITPWVEAACGEAAGTGRPRGVPRSGRLWCAGGDLPNAPPRSTS